LSPSLAIPVFFPRIPFAWLLLLAKPTNWTHIMKINNSTKLDAVLNEIGVRLTQQRLLAKLTQAGLAEKAGVSKRTVERIEAGSSIQLSTMIQVLRVFKLLEPFGLALSLGQVKTQPGVRSKTIRKDKKTLPEKSKRSHSWGY